ncbi:MAG: nitrogenase component 1 [Marvinbryantia sp.]|jgi:nitrogenase molybdenum-cofactor synthesis protein NifE
MRNERADQLSVLMYPSMLLHEYGVNGKISGSIGAIGEMKGVLPILHSPKGCGFHYRQSARRRHQPFYNVICSELTEKEIILGGEEKLYRTAKKAYEQYQPELLMLIPSPVSDVLNEDLSAVAKRLEKEGIPAAAIRSELFSHRDKEYSRKRLNELASQKITGNQKMETELKGCGFTEALYTLVDQVMEPAEQHTKSINIETVGWGSEGAAALHEIGAFLEKAGVTVNCWIPSDSLEKIKRAPEAQLNVVRRIRWAKRMKEKFGTEYLQLGIPGRYEGFEGICNFYQDIGDALSIGKEMKVLIEKEKKYTLKKIEKERQILGNVKTVLVTRNLQNAPYLLKRYAMDYGMQVKAVVVRLTETSRQDMGLTEEMERKLRIRFEEAAGIYAPECMLFVNPSEEEQTEIYREADILAGTGDFRLEGQGLPVIPAKKELLSLSFESYVRSVRRLCYLVEHSREKKEILLNKMKFSDEFFPMLQSEYSLNGRVMWSRMWLEREKWKKKGRENENM